MEKMKYLGHIINKDRRRHNPERANPVKLMPSSENLTSLQSFLGLANDYQVFIPNMHSLNALSNELQKNNKDCPGWTPIKILKTL